MQVKDINMRKTEIIDNKITCKKCNLQKELKYFCKRLENNSYRGVCKMCTKGYSTLLSDRQEEIQKLINQNLKQCGKCKEIKNIHNFGSDKYTKYKLTSWCKQCIKIKTDGTHREASLKTNYNLTLDQFNIMLENQNYKCLICNINLGMIASGNTHVDHCHVTNKIRGILCRSCNTGLGFFKDNIDNLNSAIVYLKKNQ